MLIVVYVFILGLFIGSFLNVLIDRLPREESIMGRSHCDECKHKLAWNDLLPIFSFLSVRGECRYCKTKFSYFYPFIELFTGKVFVLVTLYVFILNRIPLNTALPILSYETVVQLGVYLFFISTCIVIFFADVKYQIIPDSMQVCFFLAALALHLLGGVTYIELIRTNVVAGILVMLPILLLFVGTKGKGMGFGDVKFAFNMGFLLGLLPGFFALYVAFIAGGIAGLYLLLLRKKKAKSHVAFGPYLLLGTLVAFFFPAYVNELIYGFGGYEIYYFLQNLKFGFLN